MQKKITAKNGRNDWAHDSIGLFTGKKKIFFFIDCTVELHIVKGIQKCLWCAFMFITQLLRSRDCNPGSKRKQLYYSGTGTGGTLLLLQ